MSDLVFIRGLRAETVIGVYDWEREVRQVVVIDLEMTADVKQAAVTDSVESALDYNAVATRILGFCAEASFKLLETLAEHIAELVQREFNVARVKLVIGKPGALSSAENVGVIIERGS